jgi:hypothetical protein
MMLEVIETKEVRMDAREGNAPTPTTAPLIDCGRASSQTKGDKAGPQVESSAPPFMYTEELYPT